METYRAEECPLAARRGFRFLLRFARAPENFGAWGSDFLNYFYVVADTAARADMRVLGRDEGARLARRWCRRHPSIPEDADAEGVYELIYGRSEAHTSELQSRQYLVCRLLLEKKITICWSCTHHLLSP